MLCTLLSSLSHAHTYKGKICSRCLKIIRVAWGPQCGTVLVGLPLEVSWWVCGAQIRLIDSLINKQIWVPHLFKAQCGTVSTVSFSHCFMCYAKHAHTRTNTTTHEDMVFVWGGGTSNETAKARVGCIYSLLEVLLFHLLITVLRYSQFICLELFFPIIFFWCEVHLIYIF